VAHGDPIVIPSNATENLQYEGELVVVIGRKAKSMTEKNALDCVLGYTIGNDVSERSWQSSDRTLWRAKNTDSFKPMGPWIETNVDLDSLVTKVRLNGQEMISFKTNDMIFGVQKYISEITKYITLMPGDIIWMGTDGSAPNMKSGDICEVEISGIGVLSNPIVKPHKNNKELSTPRE
jgi:2-keto-4-pentenoate hydratase/2-oxohepta-3-ene-1,7-dioic acid hydratase in catechol pathway